MRRSFTAVVSRNEAVGAEYVTEPYECAWASEARWFVRVLEMSPGAVLTIRPEISPDGLFWCAEGHPGLILKEPGVYSFFLRDFGGWLRLSGGVSDSAGKTKVIVYLSLKE